MEVVDDDNVDCALLGSLLLVQHQSVTTSHCADGVDSELYCSHEDYASIIAHKPYTSPWHYGLLRYFAAVHTV